MEPKRRPLIDRWIAPLALGVGLALVAALTMTAFVGVGRRAGDALSLTDNSHPGLPIDSGTSGPLLFPASEQPVDPQAPNDEVVPVAPAAVAVVPAVAAVADASPAANEGVTTLPPRPAPSEPEDAGTTSAPSGGDLQDADDDGSQLTGRGAKNKPGKESSAGKGKKEAGKKPDEDDDEDDESKDDSDDDSTDDSKDGSTVDSTDGSKDSSGHPAASGDKKPSGASKGGHDKDAGKGHSKSSKGKGSDGDAGKAGKDHQGKPKGKKGKK